MNQKDWCIIKEFPDYAISRYGEVWNLRQQRMMRISINNHGHAKISLINEFGRFDRSVAKLVADAFVPPPNITCDQLIFLNGQFNDIRPDNLAWRQPRHAYMYTRQLREDQPVWYRNLPVMDTKSGIQYDNIIMAGQVLGLLYEDIYRSTYNGMEIPPFWNSFKVVNPSERV